MEKELKASWVAISICVYSVCIYIYAYNHPKIMPALQLTEDEGLR